MILNRLSDDLSDLQGERGSPGRPMIAGVSSLALPARKDPRLAEMTFSIEQTTRFESETSFSISV